MNYVHKRSGKVISDEAYWRLSSSEKANYTLTSKSVSNEYRHDDNSLGSFATGLAVGMIVENLFDDSSSSTLDFGSSSDSSDSFSGFGGGDFGGGGAGDSW